MIRDQKEPIKTKLSTAKKPAGYIAAIIVNIILIYTFNHLLDWHVPYLTSTFEAALWILNVSLVATIIANVLFLVYDAAWFRGLLKFLLALLGVAFMVTLIVTFPFDISNDAVVLIVKIALILGAIGTAIGGLVEMAKALFFRER